MSTGGPSIDGKSDLEHDYDNGTVISPVTVTVENDVDDDTLEETPTVLHSSPVKASTSEEAAVIGAGATLPEQSHGNVNNADNLERSTPTRPVPNRETNTPQQDHVPKSKVHITSNTKFTKDVKTTPKPPPNDRINTSMNTARTPLIYNPSMFSPRSSAPKGSAFGVKLRTPATTSFATKTASSSSSLFISHTASSVPAAVVLTTSSVVAALRR